MTVKNTEVNNGLEAWCRLNATYDSHNKGCQRIRLQYLLQPKRAESILQTTEPVERWECHVKEHEQRFETLDEDVKIGVILALTPPQVQNHCHLNSHILKSYAQVRTMLFDYCRARADTAASDTHGSLDAGQRQRQERQRRQEGQRQRQEKAKAAKTRRTKTTTRRAKAKRKPMPKRLSTFLDTVFSAKSGDTRRRIAGGMRAPRAGRTRHLWRRRPRQLRTLRPSHRSLGR